MSRHPTSPQRTNNKLILSAKVCHEDISLGRIALPAPNQLLVPSASKPHSKNAFDTVYGPEVPLSNICSCSTSDLLQQLLLGNDCSFIAFGAKSKEKECLLYGSEPSSSGFYNEAMSAIFNKVEEYRSQNVNIRYQLRMSALTCSQRDNQLTDLLSTFNSDPRRRPIRVTDDPRLGTYLENESEIRIDSAEQALFYLNTVIDHRIIEDEETYRTNHLFVFVSLYAYRIGSNELEGGRRRFAMVDLGIGERNSQKGELTMPVIGSILLALSQGQKHIPSRQNVLSQMLKVSLNSSRLSILLCTFGEKNDDNENIVQLASKLSRAKRPSRRTKPSSADGASVSSSEKRRSELESGSEVSGAETVIFLGPRSPAPLHRSPSLYPPRSPSANSRITQTSGSSGVTCTGSVPPILKGHTPFLSPSLRLYDDLCSPPGTSSGFVDMATAFGGKSREFRDDFGITVAPPKRSRSKGSLNEEKRDAILSWMDNCDQMNGLQALEDEINNWDNKDDKYRDPCAILTYPLEDIIEQDEESMKESLRSKNSSTTLKQPIRILSQEAIDRVSDEPVEGGGSDEDMLEKAMAASVSSIKSHDILSRITNDLNPKEAAVSSMAETTETPSEMDMYRRASHLEEYAIERIKELEAEKLRKKKHKLVLNCCQNSMASSGSTVDWATVERRRMEEQEREEEERRKDELRRRREELKVEAEELRKEKHMIDKELDDKPSIPSAIARQITLQLQNFSIGSKQMQHRPRMVSDSLPSTPTTSHRKIVAPSRTPSLTNCALQVQYPASSHSSLPRNNGIVHNPVAAVSLKTSSTQKRTDGSHSRKSSRTKVEKEKRRNSEEVAIRSPYSKVTDPKTTTTGCASSGRGSDDNASIGKGKKRQSYSASSGYESATGDYHYYAYKETRANNLRLLDKRLTLGREAEVLREKQGRLCKELQEAKDRICQVDDVRSMYNDKRVNGLSQATLIDTLKQENKVLEKRLLACQNHALLVTSFV